MKSNQKVKLTALDGEDLVLFEEFIAGKEFSTIVIQDEAGKPLALPPTQILKGKADMFDYRSKYLPGMVRKITPIDLPNEQIRSIQQASCEMYEKCHFNVYARIDGFITETGKVFLNDPNTTSGMMPSSFFFHQAAEIGLNPSQFLTYIIRTSLAERVKSGKKSFELTKSLVDLDNRIAKIQTTESNKIRVGVLLGGYSSERHISVESGRNIYEKLVSSDKYEPIPIFLSLKAQARTLATDEVPVRKLEPAEKKVQAKTLELDEGKLVQGSSLEPKAVSQAFSLAQKEPQLHIIPTNILLKDNADDIREKVQQSLAGEKHPIIAETIEKAKSITQKYAKNAIFKATEISFEELPNLVDSVFIALHGRPGEDGEVQMRLENLGLPYNGSQTESSQITIDKYATNELLRQNGMKVAKHQLVKQIDWQANSAKVLAEIEQNFGFPIIAKPADDGCSSAVKKIDSKEEFRAFASLMFRNQELLMQAEADLLGLKTNEEFPIKNHILIEELISPNGADHFLEITGGLLTKFDTDGTISYEVFEPSEALANGGILSLEEKFLAGEGQNITPARFDADSQKRQKISRPSSGRFGESGENLEN